MKHREFWTKAWTIHETMDPGGDVIPKNGQFWLQPVEADGAIAYYRFCFEDKLGDCLQGMRMYPVGITHMQCATLPPWNETNNPEFHKRALEVKNAGRDDSRYIRLEGSFKRHTANGPEHLIARMYCFPGGEANGHDWMVLDIVAGPRQSMLGPDKIMDKEHIFQDGTGHADN